MSTTPMNWLLLRGLFREQRHWGRFPRVFEERNPGTRVHCIDLPGVGTEHMRSAPLSISEIVEDVRIRWTKLQEQYSGPWSCLAISMGGMVAMDWVTRHPGEFERLVLINSSASNIGWPWERMQPAALGGLLKAVVQRKLVDRESIILDVTTNGMAAARDMAPIWASYAQESPASVGTALKQLTAAIRFNAPPSLPIPTLILTSGADGLTHPNCSRALANRFRVPIEFHPTAGHDLPLEAPEWIADKVASYRTSGLL